MSKFQVVIRKTKLELSLKGNTVLLPSGRNEQFSFRPVADGVWLLTVGRNVFTVTESISSEEKPHPFESREVRFRLKEREFSATIDNERSLLLRTLVRTHSPSAGILEIRAPMPGMIARVEIRVGEKVKSGQGLLILEAMKMENEIRSMERGTITHIHAQPGKAVEKGEVLMILQPDLKGVVQE